MANERGVRVYYFGCWERVGHHLWMPDGRHATDDVHYALPWSFLDTTLCPGRRNRFGDVEPSEQREGWAALHYKDGWTALAFWDRSVDKRHGSNSALIAEGTLSLGQVLATVWESFPRIMDRFTFAIYVDGISEGRES